MGNFERVSLGRGNKKYYCFDNTHDINHKGIIGNDINDEVYSQKGTYGNEKEKVA
jgi:hypothetical protein